MASRNFLWINKDPSSKSLSNNRTGDLPYSQINKHVQRQTARRKLKRKIVESSAKALVGWQTQISSPQHTPIPDPDRTTSTDESTEDSDEAQSIPPSASPQLPVDSYSNSLIKLSSSEKTALQYFLKVWMPSDDFIPPECQIAGFTPIWPNDGKASSFVLQGALQTDDPVSIYALLAASTRRAQTLNRVQLPKSKLPEEFSLKAIQALRRRIEMRLPPTQRLILDLSYLVLAELYARSPSRSVIFWKMTRDLIVGAGGLHKIEPFTALAALAYDYFIAMGTVTLPALDIFRHPALLGLDPHLDPCELYECIQSRQGELEARIRLTIHEAHQFTLVIDALRLLPQSAFCEISDLVQRNIPKLYPLIAAPFQRTPGNTSNGGNTANIMAADGLSIHVRHLTYRIWLWHTALRFAGLAPASVVQAPEAVLEEISSVCQWLNRIHIMLKDTGWSLNPGVTFWMCAVCFLVATREKDLKNLHTKLATLAEGLQLTSSERFCSLLSAHLPLDCTRADAMEVLWEAILAERGRIAPEPG